MKPLHLLATAAIVFFTTVAWFILGAATSYRTSSSGNEMSRQVSGVWGPALVQDHPQAWFQTPNSPGGRAELQPSASKINVSLHYSPKQRGLFWHRTYGAAFDAEYTFANPTPIPQTIYLSFPLPANSQGQRDFIFTVNGKDDPACSPDPRGILTRAVEIEGNGKAVVHTAYETQGSDTWRYHFKDPSRVTGFQLTLQTDFADINFPVGTGSPTDRRQSADGWTLSWLYPDILSSPDMGMDMPKQLDAGPVASRMAFFAPVSLLFFITVVLLVGAVRGVPLHPMHVFFTAAGFFAFHLLFAYLVDHLNLQLSFAIAALVSVLLVSTYLRAAGGKTLFHIALPAQLAYMVLFSLSFFFDGFTGLTITIGAITTLALLMAVTARVNWQAVLSKPAGAQA
jgi:hypothetical protein